MLIEVDEKQWLSLLEKHEDVVTIFDRPEYLQINAAIFDCEVHYFLWKNNEEVLIALSVYTSNQHIIQPHHFGYTNLIIPTYTNETPRQLNAFIAALNKQYKDIQLQLLPAITDIRPFTWEGFSTATRYTFIKETATTNYQENINRYISKAEKAGIIYKVNTDMESCLALHDIDLTHFGVKTSNKRKHLLLFEELIKKGLMQSFNAYLNDVLIGSILVLMDDKQSTGYFLMISRSEGYYQTGVQSGIYHFALQTLNQQKIKYVDFCGANILGVARFKASFYPKLQPYYSVTYSATFLGKLKNVVRSLVK